MFDDNQQQAQPAPTETPTPSPAPAPEAEQSTPEQPAAAQQPAKPKAPAATPIKTTQEERMWAAIGYIAFLGVVTLAMMPKSQFCKKHAQQGILLFVFWFIGLIVLAMPISILSGIGGLVLLAITIISILGIVKSISSYELKLPVISDLAKMVPTDAIVGSLTGKKPEAAVPPKPGETPATPEAPAEESKDEAPTPVAPEAPTEEPKAEEPKVEEPAPSAPEVPAEEKPEEPKAPQQ